MLLSFVLYACGLKEPQSPQWTATLQIPLANRHIDGAYLSTHTANGYLHWDSDSGLTWDVRAELDSFKLADRLTIPPVSEMGAFDLRSFRIGIAASATKHLALTDVAPLSAGTVPDFSTDLIGVLDDQPVVDSVANASGLVHLVVRNNLGVPIDSVRVALRNAHGVIAQTEVGIPGVIAVGDTGWADAAVTGMNLGRSWGYDLHLHTTGGTILSADDKFVEVEASLPDGVQADYARAAISAQSASFSDSAEFSATDRLSSAAFSNGHLSLNWGNDTPLPVQVSWTCRDLQRDGARVAGTIGLGPFSTAIQNIDLSDTRYARPEMSSFIRLDATVGTSGSAGTVVELSSQSAANYNVLWDGLTLTGAEGIIASRSVSTGLWRTALDWKDGIEQAGLESWDLLLDFTSTLAIPAQLSGSLTTNTGLDLPFTTQVPTSGDGTARTWQVRVPHPSVALQPLPTEVSFSGTASLGDASRPSTLRNTDFVQATVRLTAPAHLLVDSVSLNIEPTSIDLNSDDFGNRSGRLVQGEIVVTINNHFPIGGEFVLRLAADSAGTSGSTALVFGPSRIEPATTDASGYAVAATQSTLTYSLGPDQIALFENNVIWATESLMLIGPGSGTPARIAARDVLDWHAVARIDVKIDNGVLK
jgi:hypothetical protein